MNQLMNFLQAASNTAASNVSGPVDLIAAALRAAGVPVPRNALLSSEWMREKGLTAPVHQGASQVAGDTLGLLAPVAAAAKAPEIARGLLQMGENAVAPRAAGMKATQRGGVNLAPLKPGPQYVTNDLSQYTDDVYRQASIDEAERFMPGSASYSSPQDLWFANLPEYALGQGGNKGAMLRFNTKNMPGQLSLRKPGADRAYQSGYAEFLTREVEPRELARNLMSVTVDPGQDARYLRRMRAWAKQAGWRESVDDAGRITFEP